MTAGTRFPTSKERENNTRRERRRRAIAAKIYSGLRTDGDYKLPKHCDNNEVLKALCNEAGWIVEEDGTTYRKGCKPMERRDIMGGSTSASPYSSYYPSPGSSSFPSPVASDYPANNTKGNADASSLIPWLKNLSSGSSNSLRHHNYIAGGSTSAPVTPPWSSPTAQTPRFRTDWDDPSSCQPSSNPPSPGPKILSDSRWLSGIRVPQSGSTSPTFSLVSGNPFAGIAASPSGGSRMWTPGQSGTCSPAVAAGSDQTADIPMSDCMAAEFAFGNNSNGTRLVKAWEGERIHEECGCDDLELTLGSSKTR